MQIIPNKNSVYYYRNNCGNNMLYSTEHSIMLVISRGYRPYYKWYRLHRKVGVGDGSVGVHAGLFGKGPALFIKGPKNLELKRAPTTRVFWRAFFKKAHQFYQAPISKNRLVLNFSTRRYHFSPSIQTLNSSYFGSSPFAFFAASSEAFL
jgi:hypothetical protein